MYRRNKAVIATKPASLALYRQCLRIIRDLQPNFQKMYYDYTKLKFEQYRNLSDEKEISRRINGMYKRLNISLYNAIVIKLQRCRCKG